MSGTSYRTFGRRFGNPLDILDAMQQEVNRVFREYGFPGQQERGGRTTFTPAAEIIEEHDAYRVALEIPGVDPQHVEVHLTGHTLTVQAERREHHQTQHGQEQTAAAGAQRQQEGQQPQRERRNVLLSEIAYGHARRTFEFESEIDSNRVQAEFRNGLLAITLPKSAQARDQQRRIEIKAS